MRGGSAGNLLKSSKSRLKWAIVLEWNHQGLAAAYEWRVIPLLLFVSSQSPEAYTQPGIFWKEILYFCNTLTFSLWAPAASRWCKLSFHKAIWGDLRFCCYGNSSIPLISYYFCKGECVVPAVSDPKNTPHTPSWRPGSCKMGLNPSLLLFLGSSLAFLLLHDLTSNSLLQIFWRPLGDHCSRAADIYPPRILILLQRDVSWRSLKEILGDLEGCTPNSSSMSSLLRVNCAFGRTYLCEKAFFFPLCSPTLCGALSSSHDIHGRLAISWYPDSGWISALVSVQQYW